MGVDGGRCQLGGLGVEGEGVGGGKEGEGGLVGGLRGVGGEGVRWEDGVG